MWSVLIQGAQRLQHASAQQLQQHVRNSCNTPPSPTLMTTPSSPLSMCVIVCVRAWGLLAGALAGAALLGRARLEVLVLLPPPTCGNCRFRTSAPRFQQTLSLSGCYCNQEILRILLVTRHTTCHRVLHVNPHTKCRLRGFLKSLALAEREARYM